MSKFLHIIKRVWPYKRYAVQILSGRRRIRCRLLVRNYGGVWSLPERKYIKQTRSRRHRVFTEKARPAAALQIPHGRARHGGLTRVHRPRQEGGVGARPQDCRHVLEDHAQVAEGVHHAVSPRAGGHQACAGASSASCSVVRICGCSGGCVFGGTANLCIFFPLLSMNISS